MIKRLKTKYGVFLSILVLFSIVVTLSYSAFIFSTDKYRSTELLISKLNYGITITEDKTNLSSISGSKVTVPKGSITYYNIVISSINKIDSKYTLAYKTSSNAVVKYTDRTPWNTSGYIKGYDENTYSKRIRVVIDNSSSTSSSTVDFAVYGGYTFNTYASIELNSGYVTVTGPYTEELASISNRLVDIVENDTGCVTSESSTCLYGGDSIKNYVQYPTNEDKTKNIWRILGSYIIDGETVTKMIKVDTVTNLDNLYNTLTDNKSIILSTNKFNCFSSTCNTSDYTNIGILTNYEYNQIGGNNSYLKSLNPFLLKTENGFNEVTDNGINEGVTSSNLKPVVYIQTEVQTSGSGSISDPYTLTPTSDINLIAYTLNGESTSETYSWLIQNKAVNEIICKNGTIASWDGSKSSIVLTEVKSPDYCTIDFKDGYTVTLKAINGTVSSPISKTVKEGGTISFKVTPNDGYSFNLSNDTCNGKIVDGYYIIDKVISNLTCSITFKKGGKTIFDVLLADNSTILERTDFTTKIDANTNTLYKSTENGKNVYYFAGLAQNNWVKFGVNQNDLYSFNYSNSTSRPSSLDVVCPGSGASNCNKILSKGDDIYWRIIRTNHDGSIKLIYAGNNPDETNITIAGSGAGEMSKSDTKFVGYMYGLGGSLESNRLNTTSSAIKEVVDTWYVKEFLQYDEYISKDAIYCNDRTLASGSVYNVTTQTFYYQGYTRLYTNFTPTYECTDIADQFTSISSSYGNKKLTYPVAIISGDEAVFSGASTNSSYAQTWMAYNRSNQTITSGLTLTPSVGSSANIMYLYANGWLETQNMYSYGPIRPVISIKGDNIWKSGDGSPSNPYTIQETSSGC